MQVLGGIGDLFLACSAVDFKGLAVHDYSVGVEKVYVGVGVLWVYW